MRVQSSESVLVSSKLYMQHGLMLKLMPHVSWVAEGERRTRQLCCQETSAS